MIRSTLASRSCAICSPSLSSDQLPRLAMARYRSPRKRTMNQPIWPRNQPIWASQIPPVPVTTPPSQPTALRPSQPHHGHAHLERAGRNRRRQPLAPTWGDHFIGWCHGKTGTMHAGPTRRPASTIDEVVEQLQRRIDALPRDQLHRRTSSRPISGPRRLSVLRLMRPSSRIPIGW